MNTDPLAPIKRADGMTPGTDAQQAQYQKSIALSLALIVELLLTLAQQPKETEKP